MPSPTATLLIGALGAAAASADAPAKPAAPTLSDVLDASGIAITGYVDAAYEYQSDTGMFSSGTAARVFDARANSFTLHQASVTIAKQPKEGWGAVVNLTAGQDAEIIKSYPITGGSNFDVTQAFVQYATGPLTLMMGKFVTLSGAEVISPTGDSNFSRSILFGYAIPFTHTGLRATYAVTDQLSLILGVNNGWDQISDANKQKTIEFGMTYAPIKSFTLVVDGYAGKEPLGIVNNAPTGARGAALSRRRRGDLQRDRQADLRPELRQRLAEGRHRRRRDRQIQVGRLRGLRQLPAQRSMERLGPRRVLRRQGRLSHGSPRPGLGQEARNGRRRRSLSDTRRPRTSWCVSRAATTSRTFTMRS